MVTLCALLCICVPGQVYKLRNPSAKHLASVSVYDAYNPTKDWGFPDISTTWKNPETKRKAKKVKRKTDCKLTVKPQDEANVIEEVLQNPPSWLGSCILCFHGIVKCYENHSKKQVYSLFLVVFTSREALHTEIEPPKEEICMVDMVLGQVRREHWWA